MINTTPTLSAAEDISIDSMKEFLSTAAGSSFNICAFLYSIVLKAPLDSQPFFFEQAINLLEDIDSDKSISTPVSPYESQLKSLTDQYGDIVNSFISFFINQSTSTDFFYQSLWKAIQNNMFFPDEASKAFAFYFVLIDRRVPYFILPRGYEMSNESYRSLRKKHSIVLKKIRYIMSTEFDQKTERASLVLQELGISIPDSESSVEVVNDYERKLIILVEALNSPGSTASLRTLLDHFETDSAE